MQIVGVAFVVYVATWTGWLVHAHDYERDLSSTQYTQFTGPGHCDDETFVSDNPDQDARWPTATEPDASGTGRAVAVTALAVELPPGPLRLPRRLPQLQPAHLPVPAGRAGCCRTARSASTPRPTSSRAPRAATRPPGSDCLRQVLLLGTPALWWGGALALLFAVVMWVGARDWRFGLTVVGAASTWLPWLSYDDRPIFLFYAVATLPFVVLGVTLAMGKLIGSAADARPHGVPPG